MSLFLSLCSNGSLYEADPTPGLSSDQSLGQRNSFAVHSLPRNFVLPPLEEEEPVAGLLGARAARAARYGLSDADGAAALPPSPSPRSKSPAPSLTATMDSGFQVSEADLMEPAVQQQPCGFAGRC